MEQRFASVRTGRWKYCAIEIITPGKADGRKIQWFNTMGSAVVLKSSTVQLNSRSVRRIEVMDVHDS